jgi:hypothetical protein
MIEMAKIRTIMSPSVKSKNVTLAEARAVFRQLNRGQHRRPTEKSAQHPKHAAKAG